MRKLLYTVALFVMASACSTKPESKPYNWEDDLYQRLLTDFCMTESQVKDYIRKYIPDVTDEQMRQWEASKALECMMLDGEKRYFRNAGPNLFRVDSTCYDIKIAKEGTSPSGSEKVNMENLPEIISAVKKEGKAIVAPKRMRVTYTLTVDTNAVPAGKIIRCWLPYPHTAEVFGDYASGTNHTLPTVKAARYTGGVWAGTFLKVCTFQWMTAEASQRIAPLVSRMARGEGLMGHAKAAEKRY